MRYKIQTAFGYVSYDESDSEKAIELWNSEGIRFYVQQDVLDEGVLIWGPVEIIDLSIADPATLN